MRDDITYEEDGWHPDIANASTVQLYRQWMETKNEEREATDRRRMVEERLTKALEVPKEFEGTRTHEDKGYRIKVTGRMNRKIDADQLQEIAEENGLFDHLRDLFRWKPEINARAWKSADESITRPLADAITTTPGRPSFSIEKKEEA